MAFFDKAKKLIDDKTTYHEFLKLTNLWVQDFIDLKTLVDRAQIFIGHSPDVWAMFKRIVHADELGQVGPAPNTSQGGYGFGGMVNIDNGVAENTPMLDRVKPDLSGSKVKSYGPSYRKLPKSVSTFCPPKCRARAHQPTRKSTFNALVEMPCVGRSSMTNGSLTPSGPPRTPHHS